MSPLLIQSLLADSNTEFGFGGGLIRTPGWTAWLADSGTPDNRSRISQQLKKNPDGLL